MVILTHGSVEGNIRLEIPEKLYRLIIVASFPISISRQFAATRADCKHLTPQALATLSLRLTVEITALGIDIRASSLRAILDHSRTIFSVLSVCQEI